MDFARSFDRTFGDEKELHWHATPHWDPAATVADAHARIEQIEEKIRQREIAAELVRDLSVDPIERKLQQQQTEQAIDEELRRLKEEVESRPVDPAKVRLVVHEPRKLLPVLRNRKISFAPILRAEPKLVISEVFFFGYEGLDLDAISRTLPIHNGLVLSNHAEFESLCQKIKQAVKRLAGTESTDESLVTFDKRNIVYIGLPGASNIEMHWKSPPTDQVSLSPLYHQLYESAMEASLRHVQHGAEGDADRLDKARESVRKNAVNDAPLLMRVLEHSSSAKDRYVAAHALGLIAHDRKQIELLVNSVRDHDCTVRNNATRAIGSLLYDKPELAQFVPTELFVSMLSSPTWTDRNKSLFVLLELAEKGNPNVISEIIASRPAITSLKEMLAWPPAYANSAYELIGRIAGFDELQIRELIASGDGNKLVESLDRKLSARSL